MTEPQPQRSDVRRFVSTGSLPNPSRVHDLILAAYYEVRAVTEGEVSRTYPALAAADASWFGIALTSTAGDVEEVGDSQLEFSMMSVSKPFTFALVCEALGVSTVRELVGVNATGLPFNSLQAVDQSPGGRTNPMVNAGAIATTSLVPGETIADRWEFLVDGYSRFAGRRLELDRTILDSASRSNFRNRSLAMLLRDMHALVGDPLDAVDLYTRQCSLAVSAVDLATMGAVLADGGVHPLTGERVVSPEVARAPLAVMSIAGMYETSGDWFMDVGAPGKSGISGGVMAVAPGKGALGVYSPPIDAAGNSVRGQLVARMLAGDLGLDLMASAPATS